jgi:hypothetical protein
VKLPNFLEDAELNDLRARMGATELGAYRLSSNPYRFTVGELEELIHAGIDLKYLDEVRPLPDRTLSYKDRRVALYERDVAPGATPGSLPGPPRFHIANCVTVRDMRARGSHSRLAVSAREDGEFQINFADQPQLRPATERLLVCEACLGELSFDEFSAAMAPDERMRRVRAFTLAGFFERYRRSLAADAVSPGG